MGGEAQGKAREGTKKSEKKFPPFATERVSQLGQFAEMGPKKKKRKKTRAGIVYSVRTDTLGEVQHLLR